MMVSMSSSAMTTPSNTPSSTTRLARTVAITSGKGGVGKTFVSANLAAALTRQGLKVLVLDADLGLANLDVVLNLYPKITLHDVFTGKAQLEEAILPAPGGFSVLLAGSGLVEYSRLTPEVRDQLFNIMEAVKPRFDVLLIDTGAGISDVVLYAVSLAHEVIVVATPEPTSMTDAYATIKVLSSQQSRDSLNLVVNQVTRSGDGRAICNQLQQVVDRFVQSPSGLSPKLNFLGDVPLDTSVREAVQKRQLLLELHPGSTASQGIVQVATRLLARQAA
ncbi:MAG: MinD/ParA family protein [Burkholderiales bacterium]|nr:MinD/ParA family protein [Burkholderiales bacterium]